MNWYNKLKKEAISEDPNRPFIFEGDDKGWAVDRFYNVDPTQRRRMDFLKPKQRRAPQIPISYKEEDLTTSDWETTKEMPQDVQETYEEYEEIADDPRAYDNLLDDLRKGGYMDLARDIMPGSVVESSDPDDSTQDMIDEIENMVDIFAGTITSIVMKRGIGEQSTFEDIEPLVDDLSKGIAIHNGLQNDQLAQSIIWNKVFRIFIEVSGLEDKFFGPGGDWHQLDI